MVGGPESREPGPENSHINIDRPIERRTWREITRVFKPETIGRVVFHGNPRFVYFGHARSCRTHESVEAASDEIFLKLCFHAQFNPQGRKRSSLPVERWTDCTKVISRIAR